ERAEFRAAAEIPAFFRHEVDTGGAREAGQRPAVLVTLLEVDAGTIGEPSLHARDQVASTGSHAVVRPLVFQRVVHVKIGPVRIEEVGAEFSGGPEVSIGGLAADPETFRQ